MFQWVSVASCRSSYSGFLPTTLLPLPPHCSSAKGLEAKLVAKMALQPWPGLIVGLAATFLISLCRAYLIPSFSLLTRLMNRSTPTCCSGRRIDTRPQFRSYRRGYALLSSGQTVSSVRESDKLTEYLRDPDTQVHCDRSHS